MNRLHFLISAKFSGAERLAIWLNRASSALATEHQFFGHFADLWPNDRGQLTPQLTTDRFIRELAAKSAVGSMNLDRKSYQRALLPELIELLVEFDLRHSQREVVVDCLYPFPGTGRSILGGIRRFCPESSIIRLVRDGRDVLAHMAFDWLTKDAHGTDRYAYFVERRPGLELSRFFDDHFIERWATYWSDTIRLGRALDRLQIPDPLIRFEDLLSDPDQQLGQLSQALGIELPTLGAEETRRFMPRYQGQRLASWETFFTRRDGRLFQSLAGDVLAALGYEQDSQWYERLPERLAFPYQDKVESTLNGLPLISLSTISNDR